MPQPSTLALTRSHVVAVLGSKTTHWVPRSTETSTKLNSRLTLM